MEIKALKNYAEKLEERIDNINKIDSLNWEYMEDVNNTNSLPNKEYYAYAIFAPNKTSYDEIVAGRNECKMKNPSIALPQNNDQENSKNCIYIGSSKNLRSRIKQHMNAIYKAKTYALRIRCYYEGDLIIKYVKLTDKLLTLDVEKALWDYYKPALGKNSFN